MKPPLEKLGRITLSAVARVLHTSSPVSRFTT